jgi:hypothetical protein
MSELAPLFRIFLYIAGTWLAARGVPPELAHYITTDPVLLELLSQALGVLIGLFALGWWRIAKRFGWTT